MVFQMYIPSWGNPCNWINLSNHYQRPLIFISWLWHCLLLLLCNFNRYLSYVMDVATPTADCLTLVYDLLMPVVMKGHSKSTLSHQEVQIKLFILESIWLSTFDNCINNVDAIVIDQLHYLLTCFDCILIFYCLALVIFLLIL